MADALGPPQEPEAEAQNGRPDERGRQRVTGNDRPGGLKRRSDNGSRTGKQGRSSNSFLRNHLLKLVMVAGA